VNDARPAVNEASLRERFELLRANFSQHDDLVRELEAFVRTAPEDRTVRINPIRYAADHGRGETEVIDLFLHARKAGLLAMEWHYVCRVCGMIAESFAALNAAGNIFSARQASRTGMRISAISSRSDSPYQEPFEPRVTTIRRR
jgi:hypothetical protein